jgi:hypothetical protein
MMLLLIADWHTLAIGAIYRNNYFDTRYKGSQAVRLSLSYKNKADGTVITRFPVLLSAAQK